VGKGEEYNSEKGEEIPKRKRTEGGHGKAREEGGKG